MLRLNNLQKISIHASAKEATSSVSLIAKGNRHFNPRLREGGDVLPASTASNASVFQSTPPRRRRPSSFLISLISTFDFNPRLREGGDERKWYEIQKDSISIHASAKEATASKHLSLGSCNIISIHASAKEATQMYLPCFVKYSISIHASAKEAT